VKKLLFIAAPALLVLLALIYSGGWWLSTTQSGAQFLLQRVVGIVPSLRWDRLEGDLRDGITLHGLEVDEAGVRASIRRVELSARVLWLPYPRVDIAWLRFFDGQLQLAKSDQPRSGTFTLPDLSSPVAMEVRELQIRNLAVSPSNADAKPLRIDRVDLAARYHQALELLSLELATSDLDAGLSGSLGLSQPFAGELDLDAAYRIQPDRKQTLKAQIVGDLNALEIDLALHGPASTTGRIELNALLEDPKTSIYLSGRLSDWPDLDLAIEALSLSGSGNPDDWTMVLSGQAVNQGLPDNRIDLKLAGDRERAELRRGRVHVLDGTIDLGGEVDLIGAMRAEIAVSVDALDLTPLFPDWPEQARLHGRLRLDATPDRLIFDDLEVTAPPATVKLNGQGRWLPTKEEIALELDWSGLDWPPVHEQTRPLLRSRSGSVRLAGTTDDWQLDIATLLGLMDQPETRIQASAHANLHAADIQALDIDAGSSGTGSASGQVRWYPTVSGRLELNISDFDVGAYVPSFPGRIDAELSFDAPSLRELGIDLRRLDGKLRDQPLSGQGRVALANETTAGGQLALMLGDNRVDLDSDDGRRWHLDLDVSQLSQLMPSAEGRLGASGRIDLDAGNAAVRAELKAGALGDISLQQARLDAALDFSGDRPDWQLQFDLAELGFRAWDPIDTLELSLNGDCLRQQLSLKLAAQHGTLDLAARGALDACRLSTQSTWRGAIETLEVGDTPAGHWALEQPLPLALSRERFSAAGACLIETGAHPGRLCLSEFESGEVGQVAIGIEQVPMDLLLMPFNLGFTLTSPLSGEIEAAWLANTGLERLAGHLQIDRGQLQPLSEDDNLLDVESIRLDLRPGPDDLRVTLDALLEGSSQLSGQARIAELNDPGSARIDAQARLNLPDVGVFLRLVPELDQLGGRLSGEIGARGALLRPTLTGQLRLDDGLAVHAPLALRMEDVVLTLEASEEHASLRKSMRGGDGTLAFAGDLELVDDQWQLDAWIEGDRFRFSDAHWLQLSASPDVRFSRAADGPLTVDGDIRIDHLRAGVPPGSESRIDASADRRVRGERETDNHERRLARQLQGRLGLHFGDDAQTSALGIQASLAGSLDLLWERESEEPTARGVIRIPQGSYRAYGQNLQIEDGQVIFTGRTIDNPSLDVDAMREIFGDPQVEAAGVRIRGSARDPSISLFTEPPTSQEIALAYLLTGANIDQADSQAAINVGFYLLPRLFVSYGIGLFEAGNVLSGRFELSRRWGIRVVSGDRDTGVDLSLAIER